MRYLRGDRELHGNGVLSIDQPAGIVATPRLTFLFENREWLTLGTDTAKHGTLSGSATISASGGFVDSSNAVGCSASSSASLALAGLFGFRRRRRRPHAIA